MSILNIKYPVKRQMNPIIIDTETGADWSPVLNQSFDWQIIRETSVSKKHTKVLCAPCGLDIETTTAPITGGPGKAAFMYHWQFTFGEYVITGRVWETLFTIMEAIERAYKLGVFVTGKGKRAQTWTQTVICWIANEGYEFQFMSRKKHNGHKILKEGTFASSMRNPIKTVFGFTSSDKGGFTVYDALQFSTSLQQLAKDYCVTQKAKGDLDFTKMRNSKTKLTPTEKGYCYNDVITLNEWATFYLDCYVLQEAFMPMTSTAIIREAVMQEYLADTDPVINAKTLALHPSFDEYYRIIWHLYRGGFTYASRMNAGEIWKDVVGKDFTSSYPAVMLQEKFPCEPFQPSKIKTYKGLSAIKGMAFYATFKFKNLIQTKNISVENVMKLHEWNGSAKKCCELTGAIIDNGKLMYAQECTVTLCEYDLETYEEFYKWDGDPEVSDVMIANKDYLPEYFRRIIMHFYQKKAMLKAQGLDDTTEYVLAKSIVNGLYGLTVQKIHFDTINFDTEKGWKSKRLHYSDDFERVRMAEHYEKEIGREEKTLAKRAGVPKIFLSPYYGIWVTAIARRRIMQAINELGSDFIYCDTDSVYYKNEADHRDYFEKWNKKVYAFNDTHLIKPEFHTLGDFDPVELKKADGTKVTSYNFLTLGAKRYIKWDGSDIKPTVAGLPHGAMHRAAAADGCNTPEEVKNWIVENFADGMKIGIEEAKKNAHMYIDEPVTATVTDEQGNTEIMHEESSIIIYPIEFTMNIPKEYSDIMGLPIEQIILLRAMQDDEGRFD